MGSLDVNLAKGLVRTIRRFAKDSELIVDRYNDPSLAQVGNVELGRHRVNDGEYTRRTNLSVRVHGSPIAAFKHIELAAMTVPLGIASNVSAAGSIGTENQVTLTNIVSVVASVVEEGVGVIRVEGLLSLLPGLTNGEMVAYVLVVGIVIGDEDEMVARNHGEVEIGLKVVCHIRVDSIFDLAATSGVQPVVAPTNASAKASNHVGAGVAEAKHRTTTRAIKVKEANGTRRDGHATVITLDGEDKTTIEVSLGEVG